MGIAGTGFDWYNENVPRRIAGELTRPGRIGDAMRAAPGVLAQATPTTGALAAGLKRAMPRNPLDFPDVGEVYKQHGPQIAWDYFQDNYLPGGRVTGFVAESALDPFSYAGFGLPGKVAKAAGSLGPKAAPLVKALEGVQAGETALTKALGAPLELAGKGLKKLPVFQPSTRAELSVFEDALRDSINEARGLGYKYKGLELKNPDIGNWPGGIEQANKVEYEAWKGLEDRISTIREPLARFRAFVAKEYGNMNAGRWGEDAGAEASQILAEGGEKAGYEATNVWQARHRKVMQLVESLKDTVSKFGAEAPIPSTPQQTTRAQELTDTMIGDVRWLVKQSRDEIENLKNAIGSNSAQYKAEADRIYRERNVAIRGILQDAERQMEDIYYPGARQAGQGTFPETDVMRDLQGRLSELQSLAEGLPGFFGRMSDERAGTLKFLLPSFDKYAKYIDRDRNKVSRMIGAIQQRNPGLSVEDVEDSAHLLERVKPFAQPGEIVDLRNALKRWSDEGVDLLKDDELDLVAHRIVVDKRNELGIKDRLPSFISIPMAAWREQALTSLRYILQNAGGQQAMSGLAGVNPGTVIRAQAENLRNLREAGMARYPSVTRQALVDWEMTEVPNAIKQSFAGTVGLPSLLHGQEASKTAMGKIPTPARVMLGAFAGSPAGPIGLAFGAGMGAVSPKLVEGMRTVSGALEFAARSTAWVTGKQKLIDRELPRFLDWIGQEMRKPRARLDQGASLPAVPERPQPKEWDAFSGLSDEYAKIIDRVNEIGQELAEAQTKLTGLKEMKGEIIRPSRNSPDPVERQMSRWSDAKLRAFAESEGRNLYEPDWFNSPDSKIVREFERKKAEFPATSREIRGVEEAVRRLQQEERVLIERGQTLQDQMTGVLEIPRPRGPEQAAPTRQTTAYTPVQAQRIAAQIRATQGRLGPNRLVQILTSNGVDIDLANAAAQRWQNTLQQGDKAGEQLAAKINFDYHKTDNLEEWLRHITPFLIWPKRAMPFFAQSMAEHPGLLLGLMRFFDLRDEDTKGLPPRFREMISTGKLGEFVASKILGGKPGKLMVSPVEMFMPFAGVEGPRPGDDTGESLRRLAGDLGFGPAPWVDIPLSMAGVYGDRPFPRVLRHTGLLQSLTGTDIEEDWVNRAREAVGVKPENWQGYLVNRRIKEMSVEDTGKPMAPEYAKALDNPGHPLYQRAVTEVVKEQGRTAWLNFLQPMYARPLRETEEIVGQERAALPKLERDKVGNLVVDGQVGRGADAQAWQRYADALKLHSLAETYSKATPPVSATRLHSRVLAFAMVKTDKQRADWYRSADGDRLGRQYLAWIKEQGHNVDKGDVGSLEDVKRFLAERGG